MNAAELEYKARVIHAAAQSLQKDLLATLGPCEAATFAQDLVCDANDLAVTLREQAKPRPNYNLPEDDDAIDDFLTRVWRKEKGALHAN